VALLALGEPYRNPVLRTDNDRREAHALTTAPQYLVYPVIWDSVDPKFLVKMAVKIIDFGEAFYTDQPPQFNGIPNRFRSPELLWKIESEYPPTFGH